jgi:hypothetical protein
MLPFLACSSNKNAAVGNLSVTLKSTSLQTGPALAGVACSVTVDGFDIPGMCFTPTDVQGTVSRISLGSSTSGNPFVRLVGGSQIYTGYDLAFRHLPFSWANSLIKGDDALQSGSDTSFDTLSLYLRSVETVFQATALGRYYHVRTYFVNQPASLTSTFSNCGLGAGIAQVDAKGALYPEGLTVQRRDVMVCITDNLDQTCAETDYFWPDSSGSLYATRPSTALRVGGSFLVDADDCVIGADPVNITWGGAELYFPIPRPVTVSAVVDNGIKIYTVKNPTETSGQNLDVNVDFDAAYSLFVPATSSITDLSTVPETTLTGHLNEILIKPLYVESTKTIDALTGSTSLNANVTLTVN